MRASFACTDLSSSSGPTRRSITCRTHADPGFGSTCSLCRAFSITLLKGPAARQRLGVNTCSPRAPLRGHQLQLSPLPDTPSTRTTVTALSAQRPPDWTMDKGVAAMALGSSRPTGSPVVAALPSGLTDVPSVRSRLANLLCPPSRWPRPLGPPESARSPPDLNGGHRTCPVAVSSQRSGGRKELHLRTLWASSPQPIRKDRPIA